MNDTNRKKLVDCIIRINHIICKDFGDTAWQNLSGIDCTADNEDALGLRKLDGRHNELSLLAYTGHISWEKFMITNPADDVLLNYLGKYIALLDDYVVFFKKYEKK